MISTSLFSSILSKPEIHAVKDQRGACMFALHTNSYSQITFRIEPARAKNPCIS